MSFIGTLILLYIIYLLFHNRNSIMDSLFHHGVKPRQNNEQNQADPNARQTRDKDVLNEGDSEYVDFEEIKDNQKKE